ncbi:hypothetical protein [Hwangdonia lutea]|uniref:Lipoprotein n=1 Tax=Hwangdonia lutea TaxID=3075823 RepID=A0AA97EM21_9FLAO|nr:hypothetical protein [Hwangdonia sp. SCSIO 19198]WOD43657.1 hypothetical protein RNZ46_16860 [Hwangdonia sp. SCSIO 19198]
MKKYFYILFSLWIICFSCKEKQKEAVILKEKAVVEIQKKEKKDSISLKQLLKINNLDSIYALSNKVSPNFLKADFNGDNKEDIAFLVEELKSKKIGLIFFHSNDSYFILGAGIKFNDDLDDMNWLDILKLDNNKIQYKMLFDEETFDIIGDKEVIIPNIGISIREEEGSGGLLYFKEGSYKYLHQGC